MVKRELMRGNPWGWQIVLGVFSEERADRGSFPIFTIEL